MDYKNIALKGGAVTVGVAVIYSYGPDLWSRLPGGSIQNLAMHQKFTDYMGEYGKSYQTFDEYQYRLELFMDKDAKINAWNSRNDVTHTLAHNVFSDMNEFEAKKMTGFLGQRNESRGGKTVALDVEGIPESVDWREKGAVNPIQNQGRCGSCWAFSAIGAMEGAHFLKSGKLEKLSEQQCVDCVKEDQGCNGGWQEDCFYYAESDEMNYEKDYPYSGIADTCFAKYTGPVKVSSYTKVPKNDKNQLLAAIAKQPVSVTIDASQYPFQHYFSGIITDETCGTALDHAVLAVGYGVENGTQYYIVKNSWGADWGEKGYVRIAAVDGQGICGIQELTLYPETN